MTAGALAEGRPLFGVALILGAFACFAGIDTCAKWLVLAGLPSGEVAFIRYLAHLGLVLALFAPVHGARLFETRRIGMQLTRGAFLLSGTLLNFIALGYLPLTITSAISFTTPLMVCALSVPFLGERVGPRRWAAILVGFLGVLIVTRPWGAEAHWAVVFSIGTALSAALYAVATRRLADTDSAATSQAYAGVVGTLGAAPLAMGGWVWPEAGADWLAFALIGVFGFTGHQLLTVAHAYAPASTLAPYVYTQILYMTASSWLFFEQPPDLWTIVGAAVVVASGFYIWLRERRLAGSATSGPPVD